MESYIFPVSLQILGVFVIMAEIFIPSFGILSIISIGIFSYSLYIAYTAISTTAGIIFMGIDMIIIPIIIITGIKILERSPITLKQKLSKENGVVSQKNELKALVNKKGVAATNLRPAGIAIIDSKRLDVVTDGEYIEINTPIIVKDITGNRIIVEKIIKQKAPL